jgi:hypothetical protein
MQTITYAQGRMVVEFTTTCAIVAYHHLSCEFEPNSWRGVLKNKYSRQAANSQSMGFAINISHVQYRPHTTRCGK